MKGSMVSMSVDPGVKYNIVIDRLIIVNTKTAENTKYFEEYNLNRMEHIVNLSSKRCALS